MRTSTSPDRSTDVSADSRLNSQDATQAQTKDNLRFEALKKHLIVHLKSMEDVSESITVKVKYQAERPSSLTSQIPSLKKADAKDAGKGEKLTISIDGFQFTAMAIAFHNPAEAQVSETESRQDKQDNDCFITAVHVPKALHSNQELTPVQVTRLSQMVAILIGELERGGHSELKQFEFGNGSAFYSPEFKKNLRDTLSEYDAVVVFNDAKPQAEMPQAPSRPQGNGMPPESVKPQCLTNTATDWFRKQW